MVTDNTKTYWFTMIGELMDSNNTERVAELTTKCTNLLAIAKAHLELFVGYAEPTDITTSLYGKWETVEALMAAELYSKSLHYGVSYYSEGSATMTFATDYTPTTMRAVNSLKRIGNPANNS